VSEPIRVLVADDHPLFREGVVATLGNGDFCVVGQCGDAAATMALAERLQPDLVLLDVSMPGDGIAAAAGVAALRPETRIVMLTAVEHPQTLMAALKAGAHGYVLKGVAAPELRAILRSVAGGAAYVTPTLAAEMLTEFSRPRDADPLVSLTARENGVLELLSQGLTNREIGERLHLAEKTIKHHMTVILQKLQVRSRTEAALLAVHRRQAD
jgi:DNA-binding NarL/FixJ family response regulator